MKSSILLLSLLGLLAAHTLAAKATDYFIAYKEWAASDPASAGETRLYCQGGQKYRLESEFDLAGAKMVTVTIVRLDKKVIWHLDSDDKSYVELPVSDDLAAEPRMGLADWASKMKKAGEGKVLSYACDIYVPNDRPKTKCWVSKEHGLLLRLEEVGEDDTYLSEVKELRLEKQQDSLFEIPQGYKEA